MKTQLYSMGEQYEEYLTDESKLCGAAKSISFPQNEEELGAIFSMLPKECPITIQGGKTGIVGGAVPLGGHIMNLSRMTQVLSHEWHGDDNATITVQPGVTLMDLRKEVGRRFQQKLFFPPNPTETSATIGGMVASGAQGINGMAYGDTSRYISALGVMDTEGNKTAIERGQTLKLPSGQQIDELDAFFGKEGISGLITQITLELVKKPDGMWGITFFFPQKEQAWQFAQTLRQCDLKNEDAQVAAAEYMDRNTLDCIGQHKENMAKIRELPDIETDVQALVYVELHGEEAAIEALAERLMEQAADCGSDIDAAWAVTGEANVEKMHALRHAAPETANLCIERARKKDKDITKLATDMVVVGYSFEQSMCEYEQGMLDAGIGGCVFGHVLGNHMHVNLFPQNEDEYKRGIALMRHWAQCVQKKRGAIFSEHGIGKLKQRILGTELLSDYALYCKGIKDSFPHVAYLNQGNIW